MLRSGSVCGGTTPESVVAAMPVTETTKSSAATPHTLWVDGTAVFLIMMTPHFYF